jgi:hypothetical protein
MKKLLIILVTLSTTLSFAQDPILQFDNETLETKAIKLTQTYSKQLALDQQQFILFQKKIEEFLIRRQKIEKAYNGKEKLDMLFTMQEVETREMNDILTRSQLQLYKKIKPDIQPLANVKAEK